MAVSFSRPAPARFEIWDVATGEEVYQLRGVGGGISCGMILPNEREVLFACYDNTVRLWRLPAGLGSKR